MPSFSIVCVLPTETREHSKLFSDRCVLLFSNRRTLTPSLGWAAQVRASWGGQKEEDAALWVSCLHTGEVLDHIQVWGLLGPQTWWLNQQTFTFSPFWRMDVQELSWDLCPWPLSGCFLPVYCGLSCPDLSVHIVSNLFSYEGTMTASFKLNHLFKAPSLYE